MIVTCRFQIYVKINRDVENELQQKKTETQQEGLDTFKKMVEGIVFYTSVDEV